ncbi:hypothetical protein KA089_00105 [Candidatus Woesebacteria bacterium]|nr:hypothetical protein [Candidatus Woesebacteria bacterium]
MKFLIIIFFISISAFAGYFANDFINKGASELINPFVSQKESTSFPLLTFSIPNLKTRNYQSSEIILEKIISKEEKYDSYQFSYQTMGRKMTGQINIPDNITTSPIQKHQAIIMIRGYVPIEIYKTGMGTENAASVLANNGYITVAPDFFGYGKSDPEPEDTWQARFEKPIAIIELIQSLEKNGVPTDLDIITTVSENIKIDEIGMWAHSNGGQIALTTLEIIDENIPTTLWAPVTAPFPYSILYFSDELEDEGKEQRKWLSIFEEKYNSFDFSLTQHLNLLKGPLQIQHGNADDAALIYWSKEFIDKIDKENLRRAEALEELKNLDEEKNNATDSGSTDLSSLEKIELEFFEYDNTNHNMVPNWDKAINRDISFFNKHLR